MIISALAGAASSAMVNHDGTIRVHAANQCVSKNNVFHITPVFEAGNNLKITTCELGSSEAITQQWSYSEETLQISGGPDNLFCWSLQNDAESAANMTLLPKRVILADCNANDDNQMFVYSDGLIKPRFRADICLGFPPNTDASFLNSFRCFATGWGEITYENRDLGEFGVFSEYSHSIFVEGEVLPGMAEPIQKIKSLSGDMCVFSRWPGYQQESIQFVWPCDNSGLETTNNQWRKFDFSFENGMIISQGSVYRVVFFKCRE